MNRLKIAAFVLLTVSAMAWLASICQAAPPSAAVAVEQAFVKARNDARPQLPDSLARAGASPQEIVAAPLVRNRRVLMFTATWCGYCVAPKQALIAHLKTSPVEWKIDDTDRAHVQIVDSDKRPDMVAKYGVTTLPTFLVVNGDTVEFRGGWNDAVNAYANKKPAKQGAK